MADRLDNKVSPHIQSQLPEFIQTDHPLFTLFLKYYYEFLESGELVLSGENEYVIEETLSTNYILSEDNEKVVLESSVGKFQAGEEIVGSITGYRARILVDDFDDNKRLFITSQQRFQTGETVVGQTTGAIATVQSYRPNPIQTIQQLVKYADVDNTIYSFLDKFRDAFMESLPNTLADGISKRKLLKNIKDMYSAKGTEDGHKLFFRILFDEEATIIYPRDNMLRVSNGQWSTDRVIRIVEDGTSDFNNAIGQQVVGETSGATALLATVIKFREGATQIAELNLDANSVSGTFVSGETVTSVDTTLDLEISGTVKSIVTDIDVTVGGAYYTFSDPVFVSGGGGNGAASARVETFATGSIDEIMIEDGGSGYSVGDQLDFTLDGTEGKDVIARVSVVGGSFLLEQSTSPDQFITEDGEHLSTEASEFITQEETVGELDFLVLENGDTIVLEEETFNDLGVSSEIGEITKIKMVNKGNGFSKLPTVDMASGASGSGASLYAASTQAPMIGAVTGISVTNFGLDYTTTPTITLNRNVLVKNTSGSFVAGDQLTSHDGVVVNFDPTINILEIKTSVTFNRDDVITTITGATATVWQSDFAETTSEIGTVGETVGNFISDRGKVSVETMRIQDSLYYQDYSYVVRIGESINQWRESVRRSVHPAGWNVFGEVSFATQVSAAIQVPSAGSVRGFDGDTETYSPELASTFENLFTTVFGRRLGTRTDSVPSASPKVGRDSWEDYTAGERDVTLTSNVSVRMNINRGNTSFKLGPTLENIVRYGFNVHPVDTTNPSPQSYDPGNRRITTGDNFSRDQYSLAQIGHIAIRDLCLADGSIPDAAFTTKINIMPPSEIYISRGALRNGFDDDFISFDDGVTTFDESGTPRDTEGRYATSFDEDGPVEFDSDTVTFDTASGNEQDYEVKTFDESDDTFDVSTNSFDASNSIGRISLFSTRAQTFDDSTETYDTQ